MHKPQNAVCILYFAPVSRDARVLRQVEYLSRYYSVTVIGYGDSLPYPEVEVISSASETGRHCTTLKQKLAWRIHNGKIFVLPERLHNSVLLTLGLKISKRFYDLWYWDNPEHQAVFRTLLRIAPRVIHANKWRSLPVAARAARELGARLVLDIPEYAPRQMEHNPVWRRLKQPMVDYFLRKYGPNADAVITEAQASAEAYAREYGFDPMVVLCAPAYDPTSSFHPTHPERIRLVHHGGAIRARQLERMIQAVALANPRFTLHFMLIGDAAYIFDLKKMANEIAAGRVFFDEPVPPTEIVHCIAEFDLGIFILPPVNFQWQVSLPNKFFDFVQAGLAVCIGPSPEMARLTRQYGFGIVAPSFEPAQVAETLNRLTTEEINAMKKKALEARKELNAEIEMGKVMALYKRLLGE
jgi:hypothetical protein